MNTVFEGMEGIAPADSAERWYARLMSPDCSLREREQFAAWLSHAPENALAFEETKALWSSLGGLDDDDVLGPHLAAALEPDSDSVMAQWAVAAHGTVRRVPQRPRRGLWPMGAGIAAMLALIMFFWLPIAPAVPTVPYQAADKIESVSLADGSSIRLDLETSITVKLGDARRDIELRQGRAVFDVARDPARPFVVDAGVGTITVLGTKFQVERTGSRVSVTLLEGSVGIDTTAEGGQSRSLRLTPGQKADYAPETKSWSIEAVDPAALTSWSQGFHVFGATPLRVAIEEINRYSHLKLRLADPAIGELPVSGSFKLGDGKAVAEALPYALPIRTSEREGDIVISKR